MFCTNCGNKRNGNDNYCSHCGKPFNKADKGSIWQTSPLWAIVIVSSVAVISIVAISISAYFSKKPNLAKSRPSMTEIAKATKTDGCPTIEIGIDSVEEEATSTPSYMAEPSANNNPQSTSATSTYYESSDYTNTVSSKEFLNEQYVYMYLANQKFTNYSGVDIRIDGNGRIFFDGDYGGAISVLRYNSTSALLRYGGGLYGEGRISVRIDYDRLQLTDPIDGTIWYQE